MRLERPPRSEQWSNPRPVQKQNRLGIAGAGPAGVLGGQGSERRAAAVEPRCRCAAPAEKHDARIK